MNECFYWYCILQFFTTVVFTVSGVSVASAVTWSSLLHILCSDWLINDHDRSYIHFGIYVLDTGKCDDHPRVNGYWHLSNRHLLCDGNDCRKFGRVFHDSLVRGSIDLNTHWFILLLTSTERSYLWWPLCIQLVPIANELSAMLSHAAAPCSTARIDVHRWHPSIEYGNLFGRNVTYYTQAKIYKCTSSCIRWRLRT